jgi:hypothetical protein
MLGLVDHADRERGFSSQRSAAAMAGGRSSAREAGASAKWRNASRSVAGSIPSGGWLAGERRDQGRQGIGE